MTSEEFRAARAALGMSMTELGAAIGFTGSCNTLNARVRDMESGRREVTGPVAQVVRALLAGVATVLSAREAGILGEMADLCTELSDLSIKITAEANVAMDDGDDALARNLLCRCDGIGEAVGRMLAIIRKAAA